jgi:hypothetical protein
MTTTATGQTGRVDFRKLLWVGPLTIIAAIVANLIIQQIAAAALRPDPSFMPLSPPPPIMFTLIGVLGAVIVYAVVGRFAHRPIALFRRIALVALLVSLIPDVLLLLPGGMPGANLPNVIVLMLMHVVAWAISVNLLTRLAGSEG